MNIIETHGGYLLGTYHGFDLSKYPWILYYEAYLVPRIIKATCVAIEVSYGYVMPAMDSQIEWSFKYLNKEVISLESIGEHKEIVNIAMSSPVMMANVFPLKYYILNDYQAIRDGVPKELQNSLLIDREIKWAPKIKEVLGKGGLVAVGAGHIPGILELLNA